MMDESSAMTEMDVDRPRRESVSERLHRERRKLEERLSMVNDAIKKLEDAPQVSELMDSLSRLGHF